MLSSAFVCSLCKSPTLFQVETSPCPTSPSTTNLYPQCNNNWRPKGRKLKHETVGKKLKLVSNFVRKITKLSVPKHQAATRMSKHSSLSSLLFPIRTGMQSVLYKSSFCFHVCSYKICTHDSETKARLFWIKIAKCG